VTPTIEVGAVLGRALERAWLARVPVAIYIVAMTVLEMVVTDPEIGPAGIVFALFFIVYIWLYVALLAAAVRTSGGVTVGAGALSVAPMKVVKVFVLGMMAAVPIALGLLLLIVPGIMLAMAWALVSVLIVAERADFLDAFGESARLTRGYRMTIFGVMFIIGLAAMLGMVLFAVLQDEPGGILISLWQSAFTVMGIFATAVLLDDLTAVKAAEAQVAVPA
jgi:hypothetical protein